MFYAIGVAYIIMGGFVIKEKWFLTILEDNVAYVLGVSLILYGIFRVYRAYKLNQKEPS